MRAGAVTRGGARGERGRGWSDLPLRAKLSCLMPATVIWSAVAGYGVGQFPEPYAAYALMPLAVCLAAAALVVSRRWIARPVEALTEQAGRLTLGERPLAPRDLPRQRGDEVGQLARVLHRLAIAARNDHREARALRRTLDQRIEQATRRATAQLSQLAMRDPLTQLGNRRFLDEHLPGLLNSCRDSRTDLACIIFDVDGFKPVNDTAGHAAGDALLKAIGALLKATVRAGDLVVRLGGDEFAVFVPGADAAHAREVAARAKQLFGEQAALVVPHAPRPDLSFGVATLVGDRPADAAALLELADGRLYDAKPNRR